MHDHGGIVARRATIAFDPQAEALPSEYAPPSVLVACRRPVRYLARLTLAVGAAALGAFAPTALQAEWNSSALLRFSSNYIFRGYAKSDDNPIVQAHVGVSHDSGFYAGAWATGLDFGGSQLEFVPYVGLQYKLGPDLRIDGMVTGYVYDAKVFGQRADYAETSVSLDWRGLLTARLGAAFDTYGSGETTFNGELKGRYPVTDVVELFASMGYDAITLVTDYDVVYWDFGVSYYLGSHVVADLRYVDNAYVNEFHRAGRDSPFSAAETSGRTVLSISVGF